MKVSAFEFEMPARGAAPASSPQRPADAAAVRAAPPDRGEEDDSTERTPEEPGYGHGV